jgi:hypothetical protein
MVHIRPQVYYLRCSFVIFKINHIKFFQKFKEQTPLFEKAKPVTWLRLPLKLRMTFALGQPMADGHGESELVSTKD